jgi:hypothetical protein
MRTTAPLPPRRPRLAAGGALLGLMLSLGACTDDPFERPGTWRPAGVNEANLRAQVTDPAVLQRGLGAGTDRGQQGATAVTALEAGKRPRVPSTALTIIGTSTAGGGSAAGAR